MIKPHDIKLHFGIFLSLLTSIQCTTSASSTLRNYHGNNQGQSRIITYEDRHTKLFENEDTHEKDLYSHHDQEKPWSTVIGATIIVNLATVFGVIFMIPFLSRSLDKKRSRVIDVIIPAFASGALIATVVFLTLPEGISKIQITFMMNEGVHNEHVHEEGNHTIAHQEDHLDYGFEISPAITWRFASSFLAGFLFPILLSIFFPKPQLSPNVSSNENDEQNASVESVLDDEEKPYGDEVLNETNENDEGITSESNSIELDEESKKELDVPLILSILIGDSFHNFADGIFIGTAFLLCDHTKAWVITAVTLYHEIAQEIADYFILTRTAGLKKWKAIGLNFLAGLSVVLGGLVILGGHFGEMAIGIFMSVASGTYFYIAAVECLPNAKSTADTSKSKALLLLMFAVGAIPIALTLLNHSHCDTKHHLVH